mgnify:CR=1 FL=1
MNINVRKLLTDLGIEFKDTGALNVHVRCWNPAHSDSTPSLSINLETGIFYCFGCHMKGNAITIVQHFLNYSYTDAYKFLANYSTYSKSQYTEDLQSKIQKRILEKRNTETLHPKRSRVVKLPANVPAYGNNYLVKRGITDEEIQKYDIRICTEGGRYNGWVIIPIYYNFTIVNYFLRDVIGNTKLYYAANKYLFGKDDCDFTQTVVIVEGIFDCIKTRRVEPNCISILGNRLTPFHINMLKKSSSVIVFSDNDDGGKMVWLDAIQLLPYTNVFVATLPNNVKDPDTCTNEQIENSLKHTTPLQDVVATPQFYSWRYYTLAKSRRLPKKF